MVENGPSDYYKLVISFSNAYLKKTTVKTIEYRNHKNFNNSIFLYDLNQELAKGLMYQNGSDPCNTFTSVYRSVFNKQAPLKFKRVRANQAPFMTKEPG